MKINFKKLIFYIIITFVIGNLFVWFVMNQDFYNSLENPFNVPSIIFPIVWSILYFMMSISAYIVSESDNYNNKDELILYYIQLVVNSLWTLLFFGFKLYFISFIWTLLLISLVAVMIYRFYKINKVAGYLNILYILWLLFASYLNFSIMLLN